MSGVSLRVMMRRACSSVTSVRRGRSSSDEPQPSSSENLARPSNLPLALEMAPRPLRRSAATAVVAVPASGLSASRTGRSVSQSIASVRDSIDPPPKKRVGAADLCEFQRDGTADLCESQKAGTADLCELQRGSAQPTRHVYK